MRSDSTWSTGRKHDRAQRAESSQPRSRPTRAAHAHEPVPKQLFNSAKPPYSPSRELVSRSLQNGSGCSADVEPPVRRGRSSRSLGNASLPLLVGRPSSRIFASLSRPDVISPLDCTCRPAGSTRSSDSFRRRQHRTAVSQTRSQPSRRVKVVRK